MSRHYLTLDLKYDVGKDKFEVESDMTDEGRLEIIEWHIRNEMGMGRDEKKPNERDVYHIQLRWYPDFDEIEFVVDDTGNKGLREGILLAYLQRN